MSEVLKNFYRKTRTPKIAIDIGNKPIYQSLPLFRVGFEYECQSFNGKTLDLWQSLRNKQDTYDDRAFNVVVDEKKKQAATDILIADETVPSFLHPDNCYPFNRGVWNLISRNMTHTAFVSFIKNRYPRQFPEIKTSSSLDEYKRVLRTRETKIIELLEFLRRDYGKWHSHITTLETVLRRLVLDFEESPYFVRREDYIIRYSGERVADSFCDYIASHSKSKPWPSRMMEAGTDGTVKGPEIRTLGALKVYDAMALIDYLSNNDIVVDNGCSFHVHVSVPTLNFPKYNEDFHMALWEGLFLQWEEIPDKVKHRFRHGPSNYFRHFPSTERYSAIAYRGRTWEFRLFGCINDKKEQKKCIMIALKAFRWAIRASLLGKERRTILKMEDINNTGSIVGSAYTEMVRTVSSKGLTKHTMDKLRQAALAERS